MSLIATLKRGDTLTIAAQYTDDGSGSHDLTGFDIRASAMDARGLPIGPIAVRIVDAAQGLYELDVDTQGWPAGPCRFDVRYSWPGGGTRATETAYIKIDAAITPAL